MNAHEIADQVARSYCPSEHEGSTPCMTCANFRAIALRGIHEYLTVMVEELELVRDDVGRNLGRGGG